MKIGNFFKKNLDNLFKNHRIKICKILLNEVYNGYFKFC